jgi:uncharacterized damage-inducible protein DinB
MPFGKIARMAISEMLLPEFDQEMATTRKLLERFPDGKSDWQPHPKSMTVGRLAGHVAELTGWTVTTLTQESLTLDRSKYEPFVASSAQQLLEQFDKNVVDARRAIEKAADADWMKQWSLIVEGQTVFSMPRIAVLRAMVISHIIHHRGQLSVYFRLNDIPVPSIYGPSADEQISTPANA